MSRLCIIILTKNEEKDIETAIQNAWQCAEEVLVVDSGSTDRTVELAKKNGARVVFREWDNDFAAQRNFALTQTEADWVLYLDADERMNDELVRAVKKIISANPSDVGRKKQFSMQRKSVAFGKKFSAAQVRSLWQKIQLRSPASGLGDPPVPPAKCDMGGQSARTSGMQPAPGKTARPSGALHLP